jgi:hypothetical protein
VVSDFLPRPPRPADAVTAFEQARQEAYRCRRAHTVACVTLFVLAAVGASYVLILLTVSLGVVINRLAEKPPRI